MSAMHRVIWFRSFACGPTTSFLCVIYILWFQKQKPPCSFFLSSSFIFHSMNGYYRSSVDFEFCSFSELLYQEPLDLEMLLGIALFDSLQYADQNFVQALPLPQQQEQFLTLDPNTMSTMQFDFLTHTPHLSLPLTAPNGASSFPGTAVAMTPPQIPAIIVTPATPGSSPLPPPFAFISNTKRAKVKSARRRTVQQPPYAANLVNLNLAPTRRYTRNTNNTNSQHKQEQQRPNTPYECDYPGCQK